MNKLTSILFGGTLMAALTLSALGAGPLTPPGTPGQPVADMPSLVEIKAAIDALAAASGAGLNGRTAIPGTSGAPAAGPAFVISASGSYVLTGNITVSTGNGIDITAGDVTLDLNGFTIASTSATSNDGVGINLSGSRGIRVLNGHIKSGTTYTGVWVNAGFNYGIRNVGSNGAISNVDVVGCTNGIIDPGKLLLIDYCTADNCSRIGIGGNTISNSKATSCGVAGINGSRVTGCYGDCVADGTGISGSSVTNSTGITRGAGSGISALTVSDSTGEASGAGDGIQAQTVQNCSGRAASGIGIFCAAASYCYGSSSGSQAIDASQSAIGCATGGGPITSPSKHLGTP